MRVYLVDHDPAVRRSCEILLQAHGFRSKACASAEEFLEIYGGEREACLLLETKLPGMSGLDLQAQLSARGDVIPTVFLTGHGSVRSAVKAIKAGAIDFFEKPADATALLGALAEARSVLQHTPRRNVPPAEVQARLDLLTEREREVLDHLVLGRINKEIAQNLGISQRTVEIHRAKVREKMRARGISDLIIMLR